MFEKEAEDFLKKSLKVDDDEFDFFKNEASCKEEIKRLIDFVEQLTKAKELIEELSSSLSVVGECDDEECELLNRAEQFLKNSEVVK